VKWHRSLKCFLLSAWAELICDKRKEENIKNPYNSLTFNQDNPKNKIVLTNEEAEN
jgi:hypothetical protein